MLGKYRKRLKYLKTSLKFPARPDSIILLILQIQDSRGDQGSPDTDGPDCGSRNSVILGTDLPTAQNYSTFDTSESQDFDDIGENGSYTNRPPSYRRLKPSAPPLLSETAEHEPPSYDEVAANEEKYLRKNYD